MATKKKPNIDMIFKDSFMKPYINKGWYVMVEGSWIPADYVDTSMGDTDSGKEEAKAYGYFARLSAPGYMDCTEWDGPFKSISEASRHLVDMYA